MSFFKKNKPHPPDDTVDNLSKKLRGAAIRDEPDKARMMLSLRADMESPTYHGRTSAMFAAEHGSVHCLAALIDAGCDLAARDFQGKTALHLAAWSGTARCVALLLEAGAHVDDLPRPRGAHSWTPAMAAAHLGNSDCLALLLAAGTDLSTKDANGADALSLAKRQGAGPRDSTCEQMILAEISRRESADIASDIASPPSASHPSPRL